MSAAGRGRRPGVRPYGDTYGEYEGRDTYEPPDQYRNGDPTRQPADSRGPQGPRGPQRRRGAPPPAHLAPRHDRRRLLALVVACVLLAGAAFAVQRATSDDDGETADQPEEPAARGADGPTASTEADAGSTTTAPEQAAPASGFEAPGLLTFRGGPSRSYYGEGPAPANPEVLWSYPGESGGMCAESSVGSETKVWCGTGWTGQPSVFERDGRTWVVFGAYDRHIHFVDYETGQDILPPFPTGDIIKGSVSIDGEGLPLVYSGSRDNKMHVIAIDRPQATELWSLDAEAVSPTKWNDDWDGSPLVLGDFMYVGGENSQFHIVKLNRSTGADGLVQVAPELAFNTPGWDDELTAALNTRQDDVSIENSVAFHEGIVYFANSGGLVQGWDVSGIAEGREPTRVLRFWAGDDIDASIVVDDEGFLYVGVENERGNSRAAEVGQLIKLDPTKPDNPLVWSLKDPGGFWTTPALHEDIVIAASDGGTVYAVDRQTGAVRWQFELPPPTWQSAVIVDDVLIQGDCGGVLHGYDVSDTSVTPPELWTVQLEGCIESTPAVWKGRLFVGTRGGRFYGIGDPG
ncbi:MAG TPA: PQQ-binding-like beta-propeller repeat protein [Acidimicrobiales bacterium]|nr:PQQ-binding-like beta-propeller repeat protein [Acidimicrobiales bacterium]